MEMKVKVEGLRELEAALNNLKQSLRKPTMRRAAMKALVPFLDEVKRLAPVAPVEGGALRDSYMIGGPAKLTARERRKVRREKADEVEVFAGTSNPAGALQEFGTRYQFAQPHVRPAWRAKREQVLVTFTGELRSEIEKTAKRAAKRAARDA